jgi:hypothetical protein
VKVTVLSCPYVAFSVDIDRLVWVVTTLPTTVKVKVHVPVSPKLSVTVPVAVYGPGVREAEELTAPDELTVMFGVPVLWAKVTVPWEPVVPIEPEKALPALTEPLVFVTVIVVALTVSVKVHVPVSPKVSETVPVAV